MGASPRRKPCMRASMPATRSSRRARSFCFPKNSSRKASPRSAQTRPSATTDRTVLAHSLPMLNAIIRFSLRFRGVVYALAVMAAAFGLYSLTHARLDVFPEFAPPMTVVQTEAPGLTSEQVETLVTQPVEHALAGLVGLRSMRSKSMPGLSSVTLVFDDGANVMQVRQLVSERIGGLAAALPAGVQTPALLPLTTATSVVRTIGLTSDSRSLMELHDLAQ